MIGSNLRTVFWYDVEFLAFECVWHFFQTQVTKSFCALYRLTSVHLVHRDLNPANLLFQDKEGQDIVLIDWGAAVLGLFIFAAVLSSFSCFRRNTVDGDRVQTWIFVSE